ncbi:hypothetical protein [Algoriphagus terrigena]|uniref:hypothetical protein n=1 Tax=Algoriphagus terrigena TaxID=344884 RepID=UPI0012F8F18C|nr:hypothetical protein [Algoriphagus terrigena]
MAIWIEVRHTTEMTNTSVSRPLWLIFFNGIFGVLGDVNQVKKPVKSLRSA